MLTVKQNLLETTTVEKADQFLNSYEPFEIITIDPIMQTIRGLPFTMQPRGDEINGTKYYIP